MARDIYEDYDDTEAPKDALPTILAVLTLVVLLVACYMVQKALADHFKQGMLYDKNKDGGGTPAAILVLTE